MAKILLDECLPVKLKYRFQEQDADFQVSTVSDLDWKGLKNGQLLSRAQQNFDVFITIDQNLSYQQELARFSISVIALKSKTNRYNDLVDLVKSASQKINEAKSGKLYIVG